MPLACASWMARQKRNGMPPSAWCCGVGPAVLVDHRLLERQRQNGRDRHAVLARHVDRQAVTKAGGQVAEPGQWLRRQAVPAARQPQQPVEARQQRLGTTGLVAQALALGPPDGALRAGGVEPREHLLCGPRKIQRVQAVAGALRKTSEFDVPRPQFQRAPAPLLHLLRQKLQHRGQVVGPID